MILDWERSEDVDKKEVDFSGSREYLLRVMNKMKRIVIIR